MSEEKLRYVTHIDGHEIPEKWNSMVEQSMVHALQKMGLIPGYDFSIYPSVPYTCQHCKWWEAYTDNNGMCQISGKEAIDKAWANGDVIDVIDTGANFGCIHWEQK